MTADQDEFERHARTQLPKDPELIDRLLILRKEIQQEGEKAWSKSRPPTAAMLNNNNRKMIDKAASLLGPENFERVFGFRPDDEFNLVDPRMMKSERSAKKEPMTKSQSSQGQHRTVAPPVVTLKHLAAALADKQDMSKKQAESFLSDMVTRITKHLKKGERVRIVGLGVLQVRKRAARMGRNPATGEQIRIKATKNIAFRAAKPLKDAI